MSKTFLCLFAFWCSTYWRSKSLRHLVTISLGTLSLWLEPKFRLGSLIPLKPHPLWLWSPNAIWHMKWDNRVASSSSSLLTVGSNDDASVTGSLSQKLSSKILHNSHLSLDSGTWTKSPGYLRNPALDAMKACLRRKNSKEGLAVQRAQISQCQEFRKRNFDFPQVFLSCTLGALKESSHNNSLHSWRLAFWRLFLNDPFV